MRRCRIFAVFLALGAVQATELAAAQQKFLGEFKNWFAYREDQGAVRLCYIASIPKKETGKYTKRGETYILVTHRPHKSERDVFELNAGYAYKKNSTVTLNIDGQITMLVTSGGSAWAETDKTDRALAAAMARGQQLIVTGISSRGTKTTDTYSLAGFTAAYRVIGKACGVK
ncbi:MAG: invasion associated locus B family protein [Pseudomonadota bacterium]|nr:invasion associated locus B family protein [Pseudomonadota bacterium]